MSRFDGRVCIVTGAAQGLGRAMAHRFADEGATVVVADLNAAKAASVAGELESGGATALAMDVDVAVPASTHRMAQAVVERYGRIDVLVNNASIFSTIRMGDFEQITGEEWSGLVGVNLGGAFFCAQAVAPAMRGQGAGAIVNISSGTALEGRPGYAHYVSSKAGVIGLTRALASEMGGDGVRVNAVVPGSVETEIARDTVTPEQAAAVVARRVLSRPLVPEDIVGPVAFLASDDAAMVTGQSLVVDGGIVFQ